MILLALGGIFYSVGGVVCALKRPSPTAWFGNSTGLPPLTCWASLTQYVAVSLVTHGAR